LPKGVDPRCAAAAIVIRDDARTIRIEDIVLRTLS